MQNHTNSTPNHKTNDLHYTTKTVYIIKIMKNENTASFSLVSLGCARTLVDSEKMVESLQNNGFNLVPEGSAEKITILNTCSFIQSAIDETEANIRDLIAKKKSNIITHLAVTGCYVSRFKKEDLEIKYPDVDLWLNTLEESKVQAELAKLVFNKKFLPKPSPRPYTKLTPSHFSYIKISEGCDNWCSFCTIPKIRGQHTSKSIESIKEEIKLQAQFGAKEVLLIAEDTTCWGEDLYGKPSLPVLLKELGTLSIPWIRPMYIFPSRVDDELIRTLATTPNILPYLDMPIQHINSELLHLMNRRHDDKFLRSIITKLFDAIPNLALRTSLILGFPGETDAMFDELMAFVEEVPFSHIGCFSYSYEAETRSAKLPNSVPADIARKRIKQLMEKQKELIQKRNQTRIGTTEEVLFEGQNLARSYREAPDVDGVIVITNPEGAKAGHFYQARITQINGYDCIAELVKV